MTTKIIRAGFVSDANTYVNGIISTDVDTIAQAVKVTSDFVDGLKKGWHVDNITTDNDGNVSITVKKTVTEKKD